ncbi:MAG: hypothetical protein ABEK29_11320, partial [Bradymonadaceae bacterium]
PGQNGTGGTGDPGQTPDTNGEDILSAPESVPVEDPSDVPEPDPEEEADDFLPVEEARETAEQLGQDVLEDVGCAFEAEALEAAATLKASDEAAYARLKADIKASDVDTNDWKSSVSDKVRELKTQIRRTGDPRPVIKKRADAHEVIDETIEALQQIDGLYQRGGELVEIREDSEGTAEIQPVESDRLFKLISKAARFERETKDGAKRVQPPTRIVNAVHAEGDWGLERLEGFVDGAAFLEDGTILTTEGYHPEAELYLRHGVDIGGLQAPDRDDAVEARETLVDLLCDFEFVDDQRAAHESAWLAALLTILARPAIGRKEPTPLFLFDANQPGVGKTRLAEMACEIAMGRLPAPRPAPTGSNADDEMRKTITGVARAGVPVVFFDNVKGRLGGGALELALTGKKWSSRILQKSKDWSGHLSLTWLATSNNASLTSDMRRRTILCRIETNLEHPEERDDFKYPRIQQHIRDHRETYLKAALTLLRAWHVAGEPDQGLVSWGSFEEWSRIVRNAIVYAGGADPYEAREGLMEADRQTTMLETVLEQWPNGLEVTSSEIAEAIDTSSREDHGLPPKLIDALDELLGTTNATSIGTKLGYSAKRPIDGQRLERVTRNDGRYWVVRSIGD